MNPRSQSFAKAVAERAARSIVRATVRGDIEKILSVPADLLARAHAIFPQLSGSVLNLVSRLLPSAGTPNAKQLRKGADVRDQMNSSMWEAATRAGQQAAGSLNQFSGG